VPKITREAYVNAVQALDRDRVTEVYAELYREAASITWPYDDDGNEISDSLLPLADSDVERFATMDFHDGAGNRAFDELLIDWED